ncbi:MAG: hypothetical protein JWR49_1663, partial [Tardiphaga sp.]|nr:hypothetical protein [Tardiphaga sp.]
MSRFSSAVMVATILTCTAIGAVYAGGVSSVYSSTADKDCRKVSGFKVDGADYAAGRVCRGPAGLVVLKDENDLRETISAGRTGNAAANQPAASQGFGPFNSTTNTVEWRLGGNGKPFAMIQRWHIADNDDPDKDGRPQTIDAGGDAAAARRGVPCRLCRCEGQPRRQRNRAQGRGRSSARLHMRDRQGEGDGCKRPRGRTDAAALAASDLGREHRRQQHFFGGAWRQTIENFTEP